MPSLPSTAPKHTHAHARHAPCQEVDHASRRARAGRAEPAAPEPVAPEPVAPEPVAPEPVAPEPYARAGRAHATGTRAQEEGEQEEERGRDGRGARQEAREDDQERARQVGLLFFAAQFRTTLTSEQKSGKSLGDVSKMCATAWAALENKGEYEELSLSISLSPPGRGAAQEAALGLHPLLLRRARQAEGEREREREREKRCAVAWNALTADEKAAWKATPEA